MPRIACSVRRFTKGKRFAFASFLLTTHGVSKFLDALIDTGSPDTVLSTRDALSMRLPISAMRSGRTVGLAGHSFFNHPLGGATLKFTTDDGGVYVVEMESVGVLVPTRMDSSTLEAVRPIPSLIGNDLLEDYGFALVFNPRAGVSYLEFS